jgi:hypothetical protein
MTEISLPPATLAALRAKHIAYLAERLTDDRARGDFVRSFANAYDHVLSRPLRELVDPTALASLLTDVVTADAVRGLAAPVVREIHRRTVAALKTDDAKLGDYVTEEAREAIDALLARPDLLPDDLVHRVFEDEATEEVLRDVLYDALVEFNDSVNPFFADWGLPALLKRFMPIGSGTVLKSIGAVRAEFDKRLEPEIRKFLLVFMRKSKGKIADLVVAKGADPKFIALRRSVMAYFYERTVAELTETVDDDARDAVDTAAEAIALELARRDHPRERLGAELEKLLEERGDTTLGAWLASIGAVARPELERIAELLWPHMRMLLQSPPARAFYERVTWEFYDSLSSSPEP